MDSLETNETTALEQSSEITVEQPIEAVAENVVETTAENEVPVVEPEPEVEQLKQGPEVADAEQEAEVAQTEPEAEPTEAEQEIVQQTFRTKDEVVARIQEIAQSDDVGDKTELNLLKQLFYKFHNAETEEAFRAFIEAGGEEEKFVPQIDPAEPLFREAMQTIRERRAAILEAQEKQKQENLKRKLEILERIQQLASTPEEANKNFD